MFLQDKNKTKTINDNNLFSSYREMSITSECASNLQTSAHIGE